MDFNAQPLSSRCKCAYSGASPGSQGIVVKNGSPIHIYNGPHSCNYLPGDVIQNGVVRGRVGIPDQNQTIHPGLN